MSDYIDEILGLDDARHTKLLLIAIFISFIIHSGLLLLFKDKAPTLGSSTHKPTTIISSNMAEALKLGSPELDTGIPEIQLDSGAGLASARPLTAAEPITTASEELSSDMNLKEDALKISTELEPTIVTNSKATNDNLAVNNLIPFNDYGISLDREQSSISFIDIPQTEPTNSEYASVTITEAYEEIPVITESTVIQKDNPVSPLAGITPKFKRAVRGKLVKSILAIKSVIERERLEGSLRFQFTVNRDGKLVSSIISKSSGNIRLDKLILNTLKKNSPYVKLPESYPGDFLRFSYPINVKLK